MINNEAISLGGKPWSKKGVLISSPPILIVSIACGAPSKYLFDEGALIFVSFFSSSFDSSRIHVCQ